MLPLAGGVYLGWALGANDAANVFGTAVAARIIRFRTASILCAIAVVLGAGLQGRAGIHTLSGLTQQTLPTLAVDRRQILVCGIETHVCVYQTTVDLLASGYEVEVVADVVSSRTAENREIALERMRDEGALITSVEMVLFELMKVAEGAKFKEVSKIVK